MYDRYISHDQPILVSCICPPIPCRDHDFCAHFDAYGEEGPCGFGRDPESAIKDLWMAASAGDWFDEAFWDEFDEAETKALVEARERAREDAAVERSQQTLRSLFGHEWLMGDKEYPG